MDWGLAKVLARRPARARPTRRRRRAAATEIRSAARYRRLGDAGRQRAGDAGVHGPRAGRRGGRPGGRAERRVRAGGDPGGDPDRPAAVRRRRSAETTRVLAARGKVEDCFARLDACGAEPELVALCKRCLSPERDGPAGGRRGGGGGGGRAAGGGRGAGPAGGARPGAGRGGAGPGRGRGAAQRQKRPAQLADGGRGAGAAGRRRRRLAGGPRARPRPRRADAGRVASVALGRAEQLASQAGAIDAAEVAAANEAVRLWEQAEAAIAQAEAAIAGAGDAAWRRGCEDDAASVPSGPGPRPSRRRPAGGPGGRPERRTRHGRGLSGPPGVGPDVPRGVRGGRPAGRRRRGDPGGRRPRRAAGAAGGPGAGPGRLARRPAIPARPGRRPGAGGGRPRRPRPDPQGGPCRGGRGDRPTLARLAGRLAAADLDPATAVALGDALRTRGWPRTPSASSGRRGTGTRPTSVLLATCSALSGCEPRRPGRHRGGRRLRPARRWPPTRRRPSVITMLGASL